MKKAFKLIWVNFLVFFGLVMFLNIISILGYNIYEYYKANREYLDVRQKVPNYENIAWSKQHFKELSELKAEYQSYIGWRMLPYSGETIRVGENGLRYTPQHSEISNHSLSAVFLGGSTIWGVGADDSTTIPALFSEIGKGKYKTQNFGEHSYRAYQSYLFLDAQIKDGLRPDIVITYDGVNEKAGFATYHKPSSHSREEQIRSLLRGQDSNKSEKEIMSFKRFFLGPLQVLLSRIATKSSSESEKNLDNQKAKADQVAKAMLDAWISTKNLAEDNGAQFFCVLQPNALIGSPNLNHLSINPEREGMYAMLYSSIYKLLESDKYSTLSNNFIDLTKALDGDTKYYIDFCHLSPNGNQIIAEKMYNEIENKLSEKTELQDF